MNRTTFVTILTAVLAVIYYGNFFRVRTNGRIPTDLFIIILSSRSHFDHRQAIRNTWLKNRPSRNVNYVFAIGSECPVSPADRLQCSVCSEWKDTSIDLSNTDRWFSVSSHLKPKLREKSFAKEALWYHGYGFRVLHVNQLISLGCHVKLLTPGRNISVILRDAEEVLLEVNVTRDSCTLIKDDFCYQHLRQSSLLLPKGFEGELFINGPIVFPSQTRQLTFCDWDNGSSISYTFGRYGTFFGPFRNTHCSFVSAEFQIHDSKSILKHFDGKTERSSAWMEEQQRVSERILEEKRNYSDLLLLDIVDVYQNLPKKLLNTLSWVEDNYQAQYILKVDDDTFVNTKLLREIALSGAHDSTEVIKPPTIWSHFIHHQTVPLFGKWADYEYSGIVYPAFPSGAGYLLSGSLVSLILQNSHYLKTFQGEDITVGIWSEILASKSVNGSISPVQKREVECWLPSPACRNPYLVSQLKPEQMLQVHKLLPIS